MTVTLVGFDIGERRIGVAVSVADSTIARPLVTIDRKKQDTWEAVKEIIDEHDPSEVVLGLPRGLDGQETSQTVFTREFGREFSECFKNIKIIFQDEAGTSVRAREILEANNKNFQKQEVDSLAACLILEDYLIETSKS